MNINFTERAVRDLKGMRKQTSRIILSWVRKHLKECTDPRVKGYQLCSSCPEQWVYRIGVFRVLAELKKDSIIILTIVEGHHFDPQFK